MMENEGFGDWNPEAGNKQSDPERPAEMKRERKSRWGDANSEEATNNGNDIGGLDAADAPSTPGGGGDDMDLVDASENYQDEDNNQHEDMNGAGGVSGEQESFGLDENQISHQSDINGFVPDSAPSDHNIIEESEEKNNVVLSSHQEDTNHSYENTEASVTR